MTIWAYDGTEVCELFGAFLLKKISEKYDKNNIDLCRDNRLSVSKNKSNTRLKRIKKKLTKNIPGLSAAIYYVDTSNKAIYINKFAYHTPRETRKTKTKIANGTLYGLSHQTVNVPQRE